MTDEEISYLAEQLVKKMKLNEEREEEEEMIRGEQRDLWMESELHLQCKPCALYARGGDVPQKLKMAIRGNFGIMDKFQAQWRLKESKDRHLVLSLHQWCFQKYIKKRDQRISEEDASRIAGRQVCYNTLWCLTRYGSAYDFLSLNDKYHVFASFAGGTTEVGHVAVKNNSTEMFFILRQVVYDILKKDVQDLFRDEQADTKIRDMALTLDKMTIQHVSYTVILAYFFRRGRIYVICVDVVVMNPNDYDSEGAALMVINTVCKALGISRNRLIELLRHFAYDGVYALKGNKLYILLFVD